MASFLSRVAGVAGFAFLLGFESLAARAAPQGPRYVTVDRDDVRLTEHCNVLLPAEYIVDDEGDGVIDVAGEGIVVNFVGASLRGAAPGTLPDAYTGIGIRVSGKGAMVRNARVSGFRVGIKVVADGAVLDNCDASDNFRQRLRSTPDAEDVADWLEPHANDADEWLQRYGAAIWAEDCTGITIKGCHAYAGQNGLVLDRVSGARVYDNDFSFLSGWGIALWRSSGNTISRNACDFCVRGYSHGVYNRGQDSAGILLFEQCSDNAIVENSATHCGDGFFGFAGLEALGEKPPAEGELTYAGAGSNRNLLLRNDFSYAAAHGIEMTFGFENVFAENRVVSNAICGVWAGYCQGSTIARNVFEANGDAGYGLERGAINIEHGRGNRIESNTFRANRCGVHLWWDEDAQLLEMPWAKANGVDCAGNVIAGNQFAGDELAIHLRDCGDTCVAQNRMEGVGRELDASPEAVSLDCDRERAPLALPTPQFFGEWQPVGRRAKLRGRQNILMTEWGPYDWRAPYLRLVSARAGEHALELLGEQPLVAASVEGDDVALRVEGNRMTLRAERPASVTSYTLTAKTREVGAEVTAGSTASASESVSLSGAIVNARWQVTVFEWSADPRTDVEAWRSEAKKGIAFDAGMLSLGEPTDGSPESSAAAMPAAAGALLSAERFGTLAETTLSIPAGRWRIRTVSRGGIRAWADDQLLIDAWTEHAPRSNAGELVLAEEREVRLRVENFTIGGSPLLSVEIAPLRD